MTITVFKILLVLIGVSMSQGCSCPAQWEYRQVNAHCYYSSVTDRDQQTYDVALSVCQGMDATLIIIEDESEAGYMDTLRNETSSWIGVTWNETFSKWVWQNGEAVGDWVEYQWGSLSTDNTNLHAVVMANGVWVDGNIAEKHHYICEQDNPCGPTTFTESMKTTHSSAHTTSEISEIPDHTTLTVLTSRTSSEKGGQDSGNDSDYSETTNRLAIGIGAAIVITLIIIQLVLLNVLRNRRKAALRNGQTTNNKLEMTKAGSTDNVNVLESSTNKADGFEKYRYTAVNEVPMDNISDNANADIKVALDYHKAPSSQPTVAQGLSKKESTVVYTSDDDDTELVENTLYG